MQLKTFAWFSSAIMIITIVSALCAQSKQTDTTKQSGFDTATATTAPHRQIIVYYFYWLPRCYSCESIEMLTKETVALNFKGAAAAGTVVYKAINTENSENKHYEKTYRLLTKSVIISDVVNGKEKRWKNCEKIWFLLDNEDRFIEYITREINGYLK